jgi:hypothetical protein
MYNIVDKNVVIVHPENVDDANKINGLVLSGSIVLEEIGVGAKNNTIKKVIYIRSEVIREEIFVGS